MRIAIDETGSFREGRDLEYGIITLVTISDKEWIKFNTFMDGLYPDGWAAIKGSNIEDSKREQILKYIGAKHEIKYTSIVIDLTTATDEWVNYHKSGQIKKINDSAKGVNPSLASELLLMGRRLERMAIPDYSKFIFIYEIFREWLQFFQFDFLYIYVNNDTWDLHHVLDTQNRAGNFKELLKDMLTLTTNSLNVDFKMYSPEELKNKNHPFDLKYAAIDNGRNGIDGHKIFSDLKISNEQDDPVLLLPDLIGNTIHKSLKFRKEKRWLKMLKRLTSNRSLTMNNKFRRGRNNFYLIRGFDTEMELKGGNPIFTEHWQLMNKI